MSADDPFEGLDRAIRQVKGRLPHATLDLDAVAHAVMAPGGSAYDDVVRAFGAGVMAPNGTIDREALGKLESQLESSSEVKSPYDGRVVEVQATPGDMVGPGIRIVTLEAFEAPIEARIYINAGDGKKVKQGMEVLISPSTVKVPLTTSLSAPPPMPPRLPSLPPPPPLPRSTGS